MISHHPTLPRTTGEIHSYQPTSQCRFHFQMPICRRIMSFLGTSVAHTGVSKVSLLTTSRNIVDHIHSSTTFHLISSHPNSTLVFRLTNSSATIHYILPPLSGILLDFVGTFKKMWDRETNGLPLRNVQFSPQMGLSRRVNFFSLTRFMFNCLSNNRFALEL